MTQAPKLHNLYNLKLVAPGRFLMGKFLMPDFTVEAVYELAPKGTGYTCTCPASARIVKLKPCKHQRMMPFMLGAVNTDRFYEPTSGTWHQPLSPEMAAQIATEGGQESGANGRNAEAEREAPDDIEIALASPSPDALATAEPPKIRRRV